MFVYNERKIFQNVRARIIDNAAATIIEIILILSVDKTLTNVLIKTNFIYQPIANHMVEFENVCGLSISVENLEFTRTPNLLLFVCQLKNNNVQRVPLLK